MPLPEEVLKLNSEDKRPNDDREIFDQSDLTKMFVESLEYGQDRHMRPQNFWIPLLGLYTGARLEEICQLRVSDIKRLDGVRCLGINEDRPDVSDKPSALRLIPLHPFLLELGFHRYAQTLPDDGRVFPDLKPINNRWGHYPGNWFGLFINRCGIEAPQNAKAFRCFRHTVAARLKQRGVSVDKIAALLGPGMSGGYATTVKKYEPQKLLDECVSKLDFEKRIDLNHLKNSKLAITE